MASLVLSLQSTQQPGLPAVTVCSTARTRRVGVTAFTLGGAGVEKTTDRRSQTAWWQDDDLFSAFEFRQLIVKPCADVADLAAPIAGGLLGQCQPIDNLLRQMVGVIRLPFGSTTARTSGTVITIIVAVMGDDLADSSAGSVSVAPNFLEKSVSWRDVARRSFRRRYR